MIWALWKFLLHWFSSFLTLLLLGLRLVLLFPGFEFQKSDSLR
jgi:hypothetical protein